MFLRLDWIEFTFKLTVSYIIENLAINGEDVAQRLQLIIPNYREARNNALSLVNTPNFKEMQDIWWTNRKAQYFKYVDMFKS